MHLLVSIYFKVKVLFEAIILTVYTCTANVHSQNTGRLVLSCTVATFILTVTSSYIILLQTVFQVQTVLQFL